VMVLYVGSDYPVLYRWVFMVLGTAELRK